MLLSGLVGLGSFSDKIRTTEDGRRSSWSVLFPDWGAGADLAIYCGGNGVYYNTRFVPT